MGLFDTFTKKRKKVSTKKTSESAVAKIELEKKEQKEISEKKDIPEMKQEKKSDVVSKSITVEAPKSKQILVKPIVTEKVTSLSKQNKYVFEVHPGTNKIEVKKEMKRLYDVEPIHVAIINKAGKKVRYGRTLGVQKHWKKAIVTLKAGDRIEVYNG